MILEIEPMLMYLLAFVIVLTTFKIVDTLFTICRSNRVSYDEITFKIPHDQKRKKTRSGRFY